MCCTLAAATTATPAVVWKTSYDGPDHGEDRLTGLVADPAGNCWTSGYSFGDSTDFDFATLRVGPDGRTGWTRRYGSPFASEDRSWCLARDSAGNVIAGGGSIAEIAVGWDFLLIKYAPDGRRLWLRRFDSHWRSDDKPAALAVGPDNCLYVAGFSKRRPPVQGVNASGARRRTDNDIAVVKYSATGDMLWARFYGGKGGGDDAATSLALDRAGNCYVLGKVVNPAPRTDIALLKYRPDGSLAWSRDIDGAGHSNDIPCALLLFDPLPGSLPSSPAPHPLPLIYVVGTTTGRRTSFDYYTACLDTAGKQLWQRSYDGTGRVDVTSAACLDSAGNLIVTGQSTGAGSSFDIATVKYAPDGEQTWSRRFNGAANGADRGLCAAAEREGRIIVGGNSVGSTGFPDMVLLGYSSAGESLWTFTHSGTGPGESHPTVIVPVPCQSPVATRQSPFLVAGSEYNTDTGFDYVLMLLETEGDE